MLRILISAPIAYAGVVLLIRLSGKRTTSQMNNFDWVVTVAMGSLFASGILLADVTLGEFFTAVATLLFLQFLVTRFTPRYAWFQHVVKPQPRLLLYHGEFLREAMRQERVSELEILAAIRAAGQARLQDVATVVLETDANLTVIAVDPRSPVSEGVLKDVKMPDSMPRNSAPCE